MAQGAGGGGGGDGGDGEEEEEEEQACADPAALKVALFDRLFEVTSREAEERGDATSQKIRF